MTRHLFIHFIVFHSLLEPSNAPFVTGVKRCHMVSLSVRTKYAPFVTGCVWIRHMVSIHLCTAVYLQNSVILLQ